MNLAETSLETVLTDLSLKYRDTLEGKTASNYLYTTTSKLAVVKNFREEALTLLCEYSQAEVKAAPVAHLKDFLSVDQFKYSYKLSNLPINPTALHQQSNQQNT